MRRFFFFCLLALTGMGSVCAQLVYHEASRFPLLGKATQASGMRYERFPDSLKRVSRPQLWELSRCSAGMAIRFRTASTQVVARWEVRADFRMDHMTDVGVKGLDLYCWEEAEGWRFVNSARPSGKNNETTIVANMLPVEREFMLYLPLYDGLLSLSIGVDSLAGIEQPVLHFPVRAKPVVCYGTSILQGGCASRPGMAHTNILSRRFNREFINLGFSSNAFLDWEVAEVMAGVDAGVFVLDVMPNASVEQVNERMEVFFRILRSKQPDVPVVFVEDPVFTHARYDRRIAGEVEKKNKALKEVFDRLKRRGEKRIFYVSSQNMLGADGEATVDGIHFTDVGMMRYADHVGKALEKALRHQHRQ